MTARRWRLWRSDDSGASLVFALVFITVISLVVIAVLSLADASMRATIKLRGQAAESAAAEGAANVAVNALRESTYTGSGGCFGGTSELSVPSSQLPGPETMSALVSCTPDSTMSQFPLGAPAQAILSTANDSLPGIAVNDHAPSAPNGAATPNAGLRVSGNIYSNAALFVGAQAQLVAEGGGVVRARRGCLRPPGIITTFPFVTPAGTITPNPTTAQCNSSSVPTTCPQCAAAVGRQPVRPASAAGACVCADHDIHAGSLYRCGGAHQPDLRVGLRREHDLPLPARHLLLRLHADHAQRNLWGDYRVAFHPVQVADQQGIPHRRNPDAAHRRRYSATDAQLVQVAGAHGGEWLGALCG